MTGDLPPRRFWRRPTPPNGGRATLYSLEARIRPDFKRAVGAALLAVVCLSVASDHGGVGHYDHPRYWVVALTVAFVGFGTISVRSAGRELSRITAPRAGLAAGSALKLVVSVIGYLLVFLGLLQLLNVRMGSLLVGGAVTGVVVGIAAQQSLGNFFAGVVLLFARPFVPGQRVKIRSGALGGPFEGVITASGLMYTTIETEEGVVNLPNAGLLAAAIGPAPEPAKDLDPDLEFNGS
jgi:small conductance mechanosensitive channel